MDPRIQEMLACATFEEKFECDEMPWKATAPLLTNGKNSRVPTITVSAFTKEAARETLAATLQSHLPR